MTVVTDVHPIHLPMTLDGRVSAFPRDAFGAAPVNVYVVRDGDAALILDTGFTIDQKAVLRELASALTPGGPCTLYLQRLGEFDCVGNARAVIEDFGVTRVLSAWSDGLDWLDYRRDLLAPAPFPFGADVVHETIPEAAIVPITPGGERTLEAVRPLLRLLLTHWLYDAKSRTLFTSDMFSWVRRDSSAGPWVVTPDDDETTIDDVRSHLLGTRYWWLPHADVSAMDAQIEALFARWDVETIAPAYGCMLHGRDVVARHVAMLRDVLRTSAVAA